MNILFLLAGRGSRFKEVGYEKPKPLIEVRGKTMIEWAIQPLISLENKKYIFVILKEHDKQFELSKKLQDICGKQNTTIIFCDKITEGAAVTALLAKKLINNNEELIIANGDQYFIANDFINNLEKSRKDFSGLIPVFEATHPRWSFAKINEKGFVTEVAEKVPISNNATVGVYYFKRGKDFVWAAEEMIRKDIRRNNEFYICPVFNELIGRGDKIKAVVANVMWSMGTPEDVMHFDKFYKGEY